MKKDFLSDYQLSLDYTNATHIGLGKMQFPLNVRDHIEESIRGVFAQKQELDKKGLPNDLAEVKVMYSAYPYLAKAFFKYDERSKNMTAGKFRNQQIILYYQHIPIGFIREDIPRAYALCPECKIAINRYIPLPSELPLGKRIVRKVFREAYTDLYPVKVNSCKVHGEVKKPLILSY